MSESYLVEYQPYGGTCKLRHPHGEEESFISIEAFEELQQENTELMARVEELKALLDDMASMINYYHMPSHTKTLLDRYTKVQELLKCPHTKHSQP